VPRESRREKNSFAENQSRRKLVTRRQLLEVGELALWVGATLIDYVRMSDRVAVEQVIEKYRKRWRMDPPGAER